MTFKEYLEGVRKIHKTYQVRLILRRLATSKRIHEFERKIGYPLTSEARQGWLTTNGTRDGSAFFVQPEFEEPYSFLSLDECLDEQSGLRVRSVTYGEYEQEPPRSKKIQAGWFQEGWVPFASFGGGTLLLMFDFSPAKNGTAGQIIAYSHDPDRITYVSASFDDFLPQSLEALSLAAEDILSDLE